MAWWQKKLLRYALSRTGLLDDSALDLDNLDITLGRKNVVELKDVGLNVKRISRLAQLPPGLRVETARVLSLRLTVPADIYQSSIVAEVDGLELSLRLEESDNEIHARESKARARSPVTSRSPQHRKVHRRIPSPPPYDPGGLSHSEEEHMPTAADLAKSFLQEEPVVERRQLEKSVAIQAKGLEESIASETSETDDFGTGGTIGVPGFLAGFLQGIVDRLQVRVKNVEAKVEAEVPGDGQQPIPVILRLCIGSGELQEAGSNDEFGEPGQSSSEIRRKIILSDVSLDLLSDADVFSELSEVPSRESPSQSRQQTLQSPILASSMARPVTAGTDQSRRSAGAPGRLPSSSKSPDAMQASMMTADSDRFADAGEEDLPSLQASQSDLDIQPGDDNISWGSRRSKSDAPPEDLWRSMISEDDLPDSLVLDRASTPRAYSSRGHSPEASRSHRDRSPFGKAMRSPGSWPTADDSPPRQPHLQSPGSWPIEQSRQSMFQSMTTNPEDQFEDPTDNKKAALEASSADIFEEDPEPEPEPTTPEVEDLTVSRMFSHEEAESMYMSAMTQSPKMQVPGGWSEESPSESSSPEQSKRPLPQAIGRKIIGDPPPDEDLAYGNRPYVTPTAPLSGNVTPRARSPELDQPLKPLIGRIQASKQLLHVDSVSLLLPSDHSRSGDSAQESMSRASASTSFHPHGMPGTFSAYSDMAASSHQGMSFSRPSESVALAAHENPSGHKSSEPVAVQVGRIKCQLDLSSGRLLYLLGSRAYPMLQSMEETGKKVEPQAAQASENDNSINIVVKEMILSLRDSLDVSISSGHSDATEFDALITLRLQELALSSSSSETAIRIGSLAAYIGPRRFLSFDRSREMQTSMIVTDQTPDVALVVTNKGSIIKRPVSEVVLETLPIVFSVDVPVIEETFNSFGGLSGVLEIGNSVLSESGIGSPVSSQSKPSKGVRFEGDPKVISSQPELKLNARFGGIDATLQASTCHIQLRTSPVKTVYREQGAVATIEHALLSGPHVSDSEQAPVAIDFATLRLEYLFSPQDKDLERLLSLLTPSKDKYDNDDDILIDTLLRQRKKGAVARASVTSIKFACHDLDCLSTLSTFSDELSKLSAVAKYLPDDERPGLLSLIRIKDFEARAPINDQFGDLHLNIWDMHCAHVGLPALLSLSIGNIQASQATSTDLLRPLVQLTGSESLPMIMARMLGDEFEPTIKVKLFNICAEYSVPVILDLTGMNEEADTEEVVAELAKSVANMALPSRGEDQKSPQLRSDSSGMSAKKLKVDILIHDSAIGLQPQNSPSKALLVLTDTYLSSRLPSDRNLQASADLRKAGLFVADRINDDGSERINTVRSTPNNSTTKARLTSALSSQGFISVGSIMAAKIAVKVDEAPETGSTSIDVDVRNELLLVETCADSTQTLIATLNGLTPPTPPSKQPKYLTEPMTIEDMVASFSGDAFAKPEPPPVALFDVEEESEEEPDMMLDVPPLNEDDDGLLAESEMTSSLYGPIGSLMDGGDEMDEDDDPDFAPDTAESFLEEEDPFEMTTTPTDAPLSDNALVRELNKQCKPAISEDSVDLGNYEIEDLGFDALGGNTNVFGNTHRFNTPASRRQRTAKDTKAGFPFKLRLRDLHIIWNIYDGYDWQRTRDGITEAVEQVETRAEQRRAKRRQSHPAEEDEESVIGDFLFNSIYIGVPSNHDAQELRKHINRGIDDMASETESVPMSGISRPTALSTSGRPLKQKPRRRLKLERSRAHKVAFELKGVSADIVVFPPDSADVVSSVDLRVKGFEIFDNVPTSTWRKFLTHLDDPTSRELSKPMIHIELLNVRTLENFAASEIVLHVAVMPLRLHVDQDALDFITRFFEFKDTEMAPPGGPSDQPFIQRVEVDTVDMCLDYKPKKVDYAGLRSGHTNEFMNFVILDAANIRLKHAIVYGIKGFEPLHKTLNDVWMPDIKRNQLPTVLAGLAPVRSLVNIGSGVRDVVAIPIREYQKDGRIVRSIQKGAFQFGKTTASELARLGAKVALGTQTLLSGAEGFLTPTSSSPSRRPDIRRQPSSEQGWQELGPEDEEREARALSAYANQPLGVLSGLRSARAHLEHDLLTAKDALIAVQGDILESSSPGGAAAAVVKHAPTVILRPIIGTSRAVGTALLGVGNQIDRGHLRKVDDKYKRR